MTESPRRPLVGRFDLNLILVGLLLLPAFQPLFKPTLTQSSDGLAHLYRVVALDRLIEQGVLFSRWLPDLVYGYGLPLFVYYPPLSYYLTELPHLLGLDVVYALNLSFGLALLVSAWGVYLFVRDSFGSGAGLVAAVAFAYSPFQLLNIYDRGSLPTAWGMAFFSLALWAFYRLIGHEPGSQPGLRRAIQPALPLCILSLAAFLLSHNITVLIFSPLLAGYLLLFLLMRRDRRAALATGLALLAGAGLAAFFLIPALAEREFAQLWRLTTPPDFDFHFHFIDLAQLLSLPPRVDTGLLNPVAPLTLGLGQLLLALGGMAGLACLRARPQRGLILYSGLALLAAIFMLLPASVGMWERLPFIELVQRPSRLLALPAFLMAVLAGAGVRAFAGGAPGRPSLPVMVGSIFIVIAGALPLLYPRYQLLPSTAPGLLDMMAYEHATGSVGTTGFGEYLPVWVRQTPPDSPLEPLYRAGEPLDRLDRTYLPADAIATTQVIGPLDSTVNLTSPGPAQVVFHTFYFPGWGASINGRPAEVAPVSERGLLAVSVPAGESVLQVRFRDTPARRLATLVSIAALVITGALILAAWRRRGAGQAGSAPQPLPGGQTLALFGLALILTLTKSLYLDRFSNPLKRGFDGQHVAGAQADLQANLGDQFTLLGYNWNGPAVTSGESLEVILFWQARARPNLNYSALAQVVDTARNIYGAQDNLHPGQYPTTLWPPWGYVADPHAIPIPPGTPPGDYFLVVGLYRPDTWERLPVLSPGLDSWGDVVAVQPVSVARPDRPPAIDELGIATPIRRAWGSDLRLLGFTAAAETLARGDFLRLALFWEAGSAPLPDVQVSLRLLASGGDIVAERTVRPSNNRYPTRAWQPGERVRDNHALWVPPDLPAGRYELQLQLLGPDGESLGDPLKLNVYE
ncbi:MAG: hypothetical protein ACE5H9_08005 [Anaerolineae bacterium]